MNISMGRVLFFSPARPAAIFAFVFIRRFAFDSVTAATCQNTWGKTKNIYKKWKKKWQKAQVTIYV